MKRTTFKNANGLTARGQTTTAADMAKLGLALREHFPRYYRYFQTRNFKLGRRNYGNHNRLLGKVRGVDGIKDWLHTKGPVLISYHPFHMATAVLLRLLWEAAQVVHVMQR